MNLKALISIGVACLALVAVAPAAADNAPCCTSFYPETVDGAGLSGVAGAQASIVRALRGGGATAGATFTVSKRSLVLATSSLSFRSLRVQTLRFGSNDATMKGVGLLNGRRVSFKAVAVHNALPGVDTLRVSLGTRAAVGGRVLEGSIFIR